MNDDQIAAMIKENKRYKILLGVFDIYYVCEPCYEKAATYLIGCQNPLHQLHEAAWLVDK